MKGPRRATESRQARYSELSAGRAQSRRKNRTRIGNRRFGSWKFRETNTSFGAVQRASRRSHMTQTGRRTRRPRASIMIAWWDEPTPVRAAAVAQFGERLDRLDQYHGDRPTRTISRGQV